MEYKVYEKGLDVNSYEKINQFYNINDLLHFTIIRINNVEPSENETPDMIVYVIKDENGKALFSVNFEGEIKLA
jgi:hypothetical protein